MKRVVAWIATVLLSACKAPLDPVAVQNAEVFFPPHFRYVDEPRYCFSAAERERALRECAPLGADTLFEIVIDSTGRVEKARLVRTDQPTHRHADIVAHALGMVFSPEADGAPYRSFFFPTKYSYRSEFEWLGQ